MEVGKNEEVFLWGSDDVLLSRIGLNDDSEVTVLNAPSVEEVQHQAALWRKAHPKMTDFHLEHLVDKAKNFHQKP